MPNKSTARADPVGTTDSYFGQIISELRRRRVFRTAALYVVGAWLVMQVADVVFPALDIPERALRFVLFGAVSGFPVALIFGWFYDVSIDGIRRTATAGPGEEQATRALRRADYIVLTALIGVVGAIVYDAVGNVVETPAITIERKLDGPPMVAVLPFTSASLDGDSNFFAAGVHDDLLTQLAHLQTLRVISRTSVMEYRDRVRNIREIGKALGADAILEGGVQSAGGRIRINAQLIDARTDEHLWAETFDRELSPQNIFEVQAEIARAIASAMRTTLSDDESRQLATLPTENLAAYRAFRRAMEVRNDHSAGGYSSFAYRDALEEAVSLDPTFVRAMAELVGRQSYATFWEEDPVAAARAAELLQQIKTLAPHSADYLVAQAYYAYYALKDNERAINLVEQAQAMRPNDANLLSLKTWIQRRQGDFEGRTETLRLALTLDPLNEAWTVSLANNLITTHRYVEARAVIENSSFDDYFLSLMRCLLQVKDDGNFNRYAQDVKRLQREFGMEADRVTLFDALVANRDYVAAEAVVAAMEDERAGRKNYRGEFSDKTESQILINWFLQRQDVLGPLVKKASAQLKSVIDANGQFEHANAIPQMALLTAVEGETEETEILLRRWWREAADDHTTLAMAHNYVCGVLGLAGAAKSAVDCLRRGLVVPSRVIPFIEPLLPYYDSIRETPEFIDLLAELDVDAGN